MELDEVSKLEEKFWAMKARITCLVKGDRNTGFFSHIGFSPEKKEPHIMYEGSSQELDPWGKGSS